MRSLAVLATLVCLAAVAAQAEPATPVVDPSIGRVEVSLELPKDKPYVGEMIMLRMRSFIHADVVLDEIIQPPLTNFDWQQLGRDKPIEAMVDGFQLQGMERDIAIFPQQAGRLIIDPFVRHVTIVEGDMRRVQADFSSKPVFVDVQNTNAVAPPGLWWLPTKGLTLTDTWSTPPDEIRPGELSRRTITVEAVGLAADRLPPAPEMLAPGTIVFKGPVDRETIITEDGPIARATYVWDIRPVSTSPARLPAITIPWFDTEDRRMRTTAVAETWVAYVGTMVHPAHERARTFREVWLSPGAMLASAGGFVWTGALVAVLILRRREGAPIGREERRRLAEIERRARYRDEAGLRAAFRDLARSAPERWRTVSREPLVAGRLAALDAARFARGGTPAPALRPLARDVVAVWRGSFPHEVRRDDLPPLDGTAAPPAPAR